MREMANKIELLKLENGLNTLELSKLAGIGNSTLADILNGKTERVSVQTLSAIARALDCTIDYLVYDQITDRHYGESYVVNRYEYEHIKKYNVLTNAGKSMIDKTVDGLIDYETALKTEYQKAYDEQSATMETIPVYYAKAAAGIPLPIITDDYDLADKDETVPSKADFGVVLSGDSMEPDYPDGCTVWVKSQPTLEHGDIGVFIINGEAVCKKLHSKDGDCKLLSLNEKYEPIVITESMDLRVAGKVINHN